MKKFVIASLAVVVALAGSAVFAHQAMHHMMGVHMETRPVAETVRGDSMMDYSMPGMEHHGTHGMGDMQSMKESCQKMMASW